MLVVSLPHVSYLRLSPVPCTSFTNLLGNTYDPGPLKSFCNLSMSNHFYRLGSGSSCLSGQVGGVVVPTSRMGTRGLSMSDMEVKTCR